MTVAVGIIYMVPLMWLISMSVRAPSDVFGALLVPNSFRPTNYVEAWQLFGLTELFWNTAVISAGAIVLALALSVPAAYGFATSDSRWAAWGFAFILTGLMIPQAAVLVPFFLGMLTLGLYDNLLAVILAEVVFMLPFNLLVLRGYVSRIPQEVIAAARIDGASERQAFWHVAVPLLRPAIATVTLFNLMSTWNAFLMPLVLMRSTHSTLTVGLSSHIGQYGAQWQLLAAAAVLSIVPLLVIVLAARRQYVAGLGAGALRQ